MKLVEIVNSVPAWEALAAMKKNPKLAYRLLKYHKKVNSELKVCDKHRESIVYEVAGVEPPAPGEQKIVQIGPDSPEFKVFLEKYNEFLQAEAELEWIGIGMDELIEGLGEKPGNALTERDLELLEPFFTAPVATVIS